MKIYFDGSSWTKGAELAEPEKTRWTKLVCDHYGAEEYNIGLNRSSNRRMVRNLIDHNLDDFDVIIVQMTMNFRTEYYDEDRWVQLGPSNFMNVDPKYDDYRRYYYSKIYHEKYSETDDKIFYTCIRSLLKGRKHLIISNDRGKSQNKVALDMDISLMLDDSVKRRDALKELGKKPPYPRNPQHYRCKGMHPNVEGNEIISRYIINSLESEDYKKDAISSDDKGWWSTLDHVGDIRRMITKSFDKT